MANYTVVSGINYGSSSNDVFVVRSSPIDFEIQAGGGYDKLLIEDRFLYDGNQSWYDVEELVVYGDGVEGYYFNLYTDVLKVDLRYTPSEIYVAPVVAGQEIYGGEQTVLTVLNDIGDGAKLSYNFATGEASGFVLAAQQGGSVNGLYSGMTGLITGASDDVVYGSDQDQWARLGEGQNYFDGKGGVDVAVVSGSIRHYTLTLQQDGVVDIYDRRLSNDNLTKILDVEHIYFDGDSSPYREVSLFTGVVNVEPGDLTAFIEMYIAYFNRAPDAEGLLYWGTRLSQGMSKEKIAESFFVQPETQALYSNSEDTEGFVTAVYNNFLGRAPDAEGFQYWVKQLNDGVISKPIFLLAIINGAKAESGNPNDVDYFTDKVKIGTYFALTKGMSNIDYAKQAMALYDGSEASLAAAKSQIDTYFEAASDANNGEGLIQVVGLVDDPFAA